MYVSRQITSAEGDIVTRFTDVTVLSVRHPLANWLDRLTAWTRFLTFLNLLIFLFGEVMRAEVYERSGLMWM